MGCFIWKMEYASKLKNQVKWQDASYRQKKGNKMDYNLYSTKQDYYTLQPFCKLTIEYLNKDFASFAGEK